MTKIVSEVECSMCGLDGGSISGCELCHGTARNQSRSFTLSEERQGLNPNAGKDRYGLTGDTSPRIVQLPGSWDPSQGKGRG